jgi:hypothetical protein
MALHLKSTGIDFADFGQSSAGSSISELLDDYEEGTWACNLARSGGAITVTYNERDSTYQVVGGYCSVAVTIVTSSVTDSQSGYNKANGHPFDPRTSYPGGGVVSENTVFTSSPCHACKIHAVGFTFNTMARQDGNIGEAYTNGNLKFSCTYPI